MTVLDQPKPKVMSIDEFMALPDSIGFELIEGVLTERNSNGREAVEGVLTARLMMGALSDYIAMQFARHLGNFAADRQAGHVFGSETTYRCFGHPDTGRRADVSFVASGRFPGECIPESYLRIPADVAIEVVSPNDLATEVDEKVKLYLRHGFGEVWVVYPESRSMYVHRKGEPVLALEAADTLTGRGPLEGFSCRVAQFFPPAPALAAS